MQWLSCGTPDHPSKNPCFRMGTVSGLRRHVPASYLFIVNWLPPETWLPKPVCIGDPPISRNHFKKTLFPQRHELKCGHFKVVAHGNAGLFRNCPLSDPLIRGPVKSDIDRTATIHGRQALLQAVPTGPPRNVRCGRFGRSPRPSRRRSRFRPKLTFISYSCPGESSI